MNENDESIDPVRDPVPDIDKIHVEIAEKLFGLDALEGENFDGLRDGYAERVREELDEELRRDLEMNDEDEDYLFDIDAMEPPEPRPPHEPFRHPYTKYGNIGRWRRQDVARVGGNDEPIFQHMGDPGLARRELSIKCGVTPQIFWELVGRCRNSGKRPDGEDVAVKDREKVNVEEAYPSRWRRRCTVHFGCQSADIPSRVVDLKVLLVSVNQRWNDFLQSL
jgi:hypothetical protein